MFIVSLLNPIMNRNLNLVRHGGWAYSLKFKSCGEAQRALLWGIGLILSRTNGPFPAKL